MRLSTTPSAHDIDRAPRTPGTARVQALPSSSAAPRARRCHRRHRPPDKIANPQPARSWGTRAASVGPCHQLSATVAMVSRLRRLRGAPRRNRDATSTVCLGAPRSQPDAHSSPCPEISSLSSSMQPPQVLCSGPATGATRRGKHPHLFLAPSRLLVASSNVACNLRLGVEIGWRELLHAPRPEPRTPAPCP